MSWFNFYQFKKRQIDKNSFTSCEVRCRLRLREDGDPRTDAVHTAAEDIGTWTELLGKRTAQDLGRAAERLPSAVFWFVQGRSMSEIGQRLRPLGGPWDAEYAIDVASALIAQVLNERAACGVARTARTTRSA